MHYFGNFSSQDYYWNILQLYLKDYAWRKQLQNVPYFLTNCTFFVWEGQGSFFKIRIKFYLGRTKGKNKGGMGEKPKIMWFFAKFPLLSKIQTLSHKLLVRQTSYHHCDQHALKPNCRDFQVILSSSSWSKQLCVF